MFSTPCCNAMSNVSYLLSCVLSGVLPEFPCFHTISSRKERSTSPMAIMVLQYGSTPFHIVLQDAILICSHEDCKLPPYKGASLPVWSSKVRSQNLHARSFQLQHVVAAGVHFVCCICPAGSTTASVGAVRRSTCHLGGRRQQQQRR